MIIRKITEVTETQTTEIFHLICHEKDEGWELTREEMEKLRAMTERSLDGFHIRRQNELMQELSNLNDEFQSKAGQIDKLSEFILTSIPGEPSRNEGAVDTAIRLLQERCEPDQADQCPDYIEPLAPEVICENGACAMVLPEEEEVTESPEILTEKEEKEQEKPKKEQKQKPQLDRDYTPYITMLVNDEKPAIIRKKMMKDFGITEGTANTYYYAKVRPEAEIIKAENEEKAKVETVEEKKPEPGKFFTDEERLRIQKKLGLK
jgi:hypothetical protein